MLDAHGTPPRSDRAELASPAARPVGSRSTPGTTTSLATSLQAALELSEHRGVERARLPLNPARATPDPGTWSAHGTLLDEVVTLAETAGDVDLLVDAAIRPRVPADWRAGDRHSAALLDLAERLTTASGVERSWPVGRSSRCGSRAERPRPTGRLGDLASAAQPWPTRCWRSPTAAPTSTACLL